MKDKDKKLTEEKTPELRITFTTIALNVSSVLVALQEEAFKRSLPISTHKIGGIVEQTWGVTVKSNPESLKKNAQDEINSFETWFKDNASELCESPISRMLKGM